MNRQEAQTILHTYLHNPNLIKHCLACEASMKALYKRLHDADYNHQTEEEWGITGLLHDADYEIAQTTDQLEKHGLLLFEKETTIPENIAHAIKSHNYENTGVIPESDMDWAIACVDQLTGLITAVALVKPERQLASVTLDSVMKKFPNASFAKGARREAIILCEEKLGIPLEEFVSITLSAMQSIHQNLGL